MNAPTLPRLAALTSPTLGALLRGGPVVALLPVGSVEPHGPHLPLGTDTVLSEAAAEAAVAALRARGVEPVLAPSVPFGVTDFARGFPGAAGVTPEALTAYVRAVAEGLLSAGFAQVCVINNHLEPAHDGALRAVLEAFPGGRVTVACPLTRRWARTLTEEFKRGECHAGRYETSLLLAAAPDTVDRAAQEALPRVPVSLSEGIRAGLGTFLAMGMHRAYAGSPAEATQAEGEESLARLGEMVATEVLEGLARCGVLQPGIT
ncbi:MAG: creatininase family protein [Deltaproteobacteria bacterium]|nr:creatininase family protein [Deltaproteobacteria bacterium]